MKNTSTIVDPEFLKDRPTDDEAMSAAGKRLPENDGRGKRIPAKEDPIPVIDRKAPRGKLISRKSDSTDIPTASDDIPATKDPLF